jgi:hypothetical protein
LLGEANTCQLVSRARKHIADGRRAHPSVRASSGDFWRPLSVLPKREIWPDWNVFSLRMLSLTRMEVGLCARRGSGFWRERVAKVIAAIASHFWKGMTPAWVVTALSEMLPGKA